MTFHRRLALFALSFVLLLGACDLTEINENPNEPTSVPLDLQLSALLANFSYQVVGNEPARTPNMWVQQIAANANPLTEDNYELTATDVNNLWEFFAYTDIMNNARILAAEAEASGNPAYAAIANTVLAWCLGIVTDLWGEVPWSEAFDPANTTPAYDSQEQVYEAIFALLDEATAQYDAASTLTPANDDLLYGGDMQKWERLTYTLLARMHMRLTNAPGNDAAQRAQQACTALENGFQSNADDADFAYFDASGSENPWYQWTIDSKWVTSRQLSAHYVDLLKMREDPRLPVQVRQVGAVNASGPVAGFEPAPFTDEMFALDDTSYVGHVNGQSGVPTRDRSSIGRFYSDPDAPLTWISYAEALFLEAECTFRTEGAATAQPVFEEAIGASMDKLGIDAAARDAYIAARLDLTADDALEQIITEKYIANFLNLENYNDWRRTAFPRLEPVQNRPQTPSGIIPLRYLYPQSERNTNLASVQATGVPASFAAMEMPVWWDAD